MHRYLIRTDCSCYCLLPRLCGDKRLKHTRVNHLFEVASQGDINIVYLPERCMCVCVSPNPHAPSSSSSVRGCERGHVHRLLYGNGFLYFSQQRLCEWETTVAVSIHLTNSEPVQPACISTHSNAHSCGRQMAPLSSVIFPYLYFFFPPVFPAFPAAHMCWHLIFIHPSSTILLFFPCSLYPLFPLPICPLSSGDSAPACC